MATASSANSAADYPTSRGAAGGKLRGVEAGRGIAALLVACVHSTMLLGGPAYAGRLPLFGLFRFGHAGVDFFFVLSGFIIYYIHYGEIGQYRAVKAYLYKRFVRIYPTYWIVLLFFSLVLLYSPTKDPLDDDWRNMLSSFLLLPSLRGPVLGPAWTLRHELLFYALFALLFFGRHLGRAALAIWAAGIIWNIGYIWVTGNAFFGGIAGDLVFRIFNIEFFFGMAVARLVLGRRWWRPVTLLVIGTTLFLGNGVFESFGPSLPIEYPPRHLVYALGAAMTLCGLVGAEAAGALRVPAPLVRLGGASYSLYLIHVIVLLFFQQFLLRVKHFVPLQPEIIFFVGLALCLVISIAFSERVEQPLLRRLRRATAIPRSAPVASVTGEVL
jgi:exopolysaccharide production protein ExoZ